MAEPSKVIHIRNVGHEISEVLEDVEKNLFTLRQTLSGDGEVEPNQEQVLQIALEICKEGVLWLFVQNLPSLGWEGRKDLVHCWCILLRQKVDESYCCVQYIENHVDLLDFLVVCYKNLEVTLNCGNMLRECIKYPTLAKYILESSSFELFFQYVELPNFDIASNALNTFKDLLTKHEAAVSEFLSSHYEQFFEFYTRLLTSTNYVTRRQSIKVVVPAHPLISHWVSVLRDQATPSHAFKSAMGELGRLLIYEATRDWLSTVTREIQSPMGTAVVESINPMEPIMIVPILRAGLALAEFAPSILPSTRTFHLGEKRYRVCHLKASNLPVECSIANFLDWS